MDKALDTNHPLVLRAHPPGVQNRGNLRPPTRLQGAYGILPKCPRSQLVQPTHTSTGRDSQQQKSKTKAAADFKRWLGTLAATDIVLYTEGSQLQPGATGYGYVAYRGLVKLTGGKGMLGAAEVFDAEAEGAQHSLQAMLGLQAVRDTAPTCIHVCLDNTAVI
jgi:hypothetical protein